MFVTTWCTEYEDEARAPQYYVPAVGGGDEAAEVLCGGLCEARIVVWSGGICVTWFGLLLLITFHLLAVHL